MSQTVAKEDLDAALAYERLHVPSLFGQWAPLVATAGQIGAGHRVLDVACGTGVLARESAERTGDPSSVSGVDVAPGMLAAARQFAPDIDWRLAGAESLPFDDDTFDAVVSQFGLMFFSDRHKATGEMRRVLRPEGSLAVAVWDSLGNARAYDETARMLERMAGRCAADALRAPFVLGDGRDLRQLFAQAGFDDFALSTHEGRGTFPSIQAMVEAELRGWLPIMGITLDEALITDILTEAQDVLGPYARPDGATDFAIRAHILTARAT